MGEIFDESEQPGLPIDQILRPLLKKPFFAYEPGEQKTRQYNMPVDPKDYRFGKRPEGNLGTVQECMVFQNAGPTAYTEIERKTIEDFKNKRRDLLGVSRTGTCAKQVGPGTGTQNGADGPHQNQDDGGRHPGLPH